LLLEPHSWGSFYIHERITSDRAPGRSGRAPVQPLRLGLDRSSSIDRPRCGEAEGAVIHAGRHKGQEQQRIRDAGADYLLAVKSNQPSLRAEIESLFADADPADLDSTTDHDKGHGRIEQRTVTVARQVDWLDGDRRFPGEVRLPDVATVVKVASRAELKDRCRFETRYYVSSAALCAPRAAEAIRAHWAIENSLHWVLDVTFGDDQSRLRTGHGAKNMAVVRHFAINLVRTAKDKRSIKLRRKRAGWDPNYLATILGHLTR
jgi:predicted transposase YbfD/YdcC